MLKASGGQGENRSWALNSEGSGQEGKVASPERAFFFATLWGQRKAGQGSTAASQEVPAPHIRVPALTRNTFLPQFLSPFSEGNTSFPWVEEHPSSRSRRQLCSPCAPTWGGGKILLLITVTQLWQPVSPKQGPGEKNKIKSKLLKEFQMVQ